MQEISVHLKFTTLAAAIAFLAAGEKVAPGAAALSGVGVDGVGTISTDKPEPEKVTAKKGKASAALAGAASNAKPQDDAATQESASTAESPSPSTAETASEKKADLPTYDKTDLPARIMAIVKGQAKKPALVELLGTFGVKSGKELKPEQLADFGAKLATLEAAEEDLA